MKGSCWVFDRTRHDYTDNEVELATRLQTVLTVFEHTLTYRNTGSAETDATLRYGLTTREVEVLELVAQGCTAHAIADYLRISEATVRKHLENAYRKLGVGDRLLAVTTARRLGLITS
ncbi:response regulator transcription factor [Diaminobutyricibacter sp. McL0618]|uniref:response regulator transcription factor n=1 Tax=Leifsonia sp. McL0618 TaxID=3415677 RepID=UPI003CF2E84A